MPIIPRTPKPHPPEEKLYWWMITIICKSSSLGVQIRVVNEFVSTNKPNITKKEILKAMRDLDSTSALLSISHLGEMSKKEFCEEE